MAPVNTPTQKGKKETQLERLLLGMVAAANREGYAGATVSEVIAQARVSRPTFYDYFGDRDACFLAAVADANERLRAAVADALRGATPDEALATALTAQLDFAVARPALARFLFNEPLAGGPQALDARDRGVAALARLVEQAESQPDGAGEAVAPDLPPWLVLASAQRLFASRMRRGLPLTGAMLADLLAWLGAYRQVRRLHRWRSRRPGEPATPSPFVPEAHMRAPAPLPPGRPRLSEAEVAENHRQRIFFAAARLAKEQGYTATTIAEITDQAGLDRRAFYALFRDKRDAFMAMQEFGFQRLLAITAGAFFAGGSWPERVWEGVRGLTQFLDTNSTFVSIGFVEASAVGPGALQRIEDSIAAFAVFLQEGYQLQDRPEQPPRLALEAAITTIFELLHREARADGEPNMRGLLAPLSFICLTPFMGYAPATAFVEARLD